MAVEHVNFIHIPKNAGTTLRQLIDAQGSGGFLCYHGHETDPVALGGDQLIVLRDPVDRFCSAVRYATGPPWHVDVGAASPNDFALAMSDAANEHHERVMAEVRNTQHRVGGVLLEWKQTYASQHHWHTPGQRVALFEHLREDLEHLFRARGQGLPALENLNTSQGGHGLGDEARAYLERTFRRDIELYERYKDMDRHKRLAREADP
mmetsp:Transcript_31592/g.80441  ORF Transcript_31592/g.80441 Transcript_31592/m.80441 type:complete len:207 (-) Transcript_31592:156-776(-)